MFLLRLTAVECTSSVGSSSFPLLKFQRLLGESAHTKCHSAFEPPRGPKMCWPHMLKRKARDPKKALSVYDHFKFLQSLHSLFSLRSMLELHLAGQVNVRSKIVQSSEREAIKRLATNTKIPRGEGPALTRSADQGRASNMSSSFPLDFSFLSQEGQQSNGGVGGSIAGESSGAGSSAPGQRPQPPPPQQQQLQQPKPHQQQQQPYQIHSINRPVLAAQAPKIELSVGVNAPDSGSSNRSHSNLETGGVIVGGAMAEQAGVSNHPPRQYQQNQQQTQQQQQQHQQMSAPARPFPATAGDMLRSLLVSLVPHDPAIGQGWQSSAAERTPTRRGRGGCRVGWRQHARPEPAGDPCESLSAREPGAATCAPPPSPIFPLPPLRVPQP